MRVVIPATIVSISFVACSTPPTAPSAYVPPPELPVSGPTIPRGPYSLTGVVTERSPQGDRPIEGANVNAWVQTGRIGYSYMYANGPRLTDAQGRYQLANLPDGATVQFQV